MRRAIAFTAAVLAALGQADAFTCPGSSMAGATLRFSSSRSAVAAAPSLRSSTRSLSGKPRKQVAVKMTQTFTESETWQNTDIPALLKEGAAYFLEDKDVKFTPTDGGVNNLVQVRVSAHVFLSCIYPGAGESFGTRISIVYISWCR